MAGGGIIGAGLNLLMDEGKNESRPPSFAETSQYDPNVQFYNGQPGGRQAYTQQNDQRMALAEGRTPVQANFSGNQPNYAQAQRYATMGLGARNTQQQATNLMMNRATGATPSIAEMQAQRDMRRATASQMSAAASARGPAAMALAQQTSANNIANAHGAISNQAQINAAQERERAEQAAFGAASGMRGGDLASQNTQVGMTQFGAGLGTQQTLANAQLAQQGRALNDQRAMGYEQLSANANAQELQARTMNQGTLANSFNSANALNFQRQQANANRQGDRADSFGNAVGEAADSVLSMFALSDMRSKQPLQLRDGGRQVIDMGEIDDADPAALDDRAAQFGPYHRFGDPPAANPSEGPTSRESLHAGIEGRTAEDRAGESPTQQWERSHGPASAASAGVRDGQGDSGASAQQFLASLFGGRRGEPAQLAQGGQKPTMFSDERAKQASYMAGRADAVKHIVGRVKAPDMEAAVMDLYAPKKAAPPPAPAKLPIPSEAGSREVERGRPTENPRPVFRDTTGQKPLPPGVTPADLYQPPAAPPAPVPSYLARREHGGPFAARQKFVVGEAGPEVIELDQPGNVVSNDQLRWGADGEAYVGDRPFDRQAKGFRRDTPAEQAAIKRRAEDDAGRQADAEIARMRSSLSRGASVSLDEGDVDSPDYRRAAGLSLDDGPVADGNRAMRGEPYAYKDEFRPGHERPGQPHYGFMAQNLAKSPVTATAVEEDPQTGMLSVDRDRMLQAVASGVADLQRQQDETRLVLADGGRRRR